VSAVSVAGLILAAGESRRMGSPKALLRYRGQTFLDTLISLFAARCSPVIVVLGADADQIRRGLSCGNAPGNAPGPAPHPAGPDAPHPARHATHHATFVINPDYRTGQTSSMQCGLRAIPPDAEGVLFTLADHPAVAASTIEALTAQPRPLIRVPRFEGRRGHPVWFSRAIIAEFLALPASGAARDVVYSHTDETEYLDVNDPGIVADIDDPAAYRELIGAGA
jgi:molybdenum cofactor cytidylyltransferase